MTWDGRRQVGIGHIGVGTVTVVTSTLWIHRFHQRVPWRRALQAELSPYLDLLANRRHPKLTQTVLVLQGMQRRKNH